MAKKVAHLKKFQFTKGKPKKSGPKKAGKKK